jgi:hypothetical protein
MPDPYERHARGPDDWGGNPGRGPALAAVVADQLADPAPAKIPPAPKNTRDNCKGKPGRPHVPVITMPPGTRPPFACKWIPHWDRDGHEYDGASWHCSHRERCDRCEKILREGWELTWAECDAYPGDPEQKARAEADAAEWAARPRGGWRRRSIPPGRQGYRRPKAGGQ